jgi:hypothetical protein
MVDNDRKNFPLLQSVRFINNPEADYIKESPLPICPRLIDMFADFIYKGGYNSYQVQTASVQFRKTLYRSFLSTLKPEEKQLNLFDEIQNAELI